jgi:hypothetical protein
MFHWLVLSTFMVDGLNAIGYLAPPVSRTRKYESSVLKLSPFDPLGVSVIVRL